MLMELPQMHNFVSVEFPKTLLQSQIAYLTLPS